MKKLEKMVFNTSSKLLSFLRYSTFCSFFPFLSTVFRFKISVQKKNFWKSVLQIKEADMKLGEKEKIKLPFSWSFLKQLIFKSLIYTLAVLG